MSSNGLRVRVRQGLLLRRLSEETSPRLPIPTTDPYRPLSHHAEGSFALGQGRVRERCLGVLSRGFKSAGSGVWNHPHPNLSSHSEYFLSEFLYEKSNGFKKKEML